MAEESESGPSEFSGSDSDANGDDVSGRESGETPDTAAEPEAEASPDADSDDLYTPEESLLSDSDESFGTGAPVHEGDDVKADGASETDAAVSDFDDGFDDADAASADTELADGVIEGPAEDQEMPLADHIEEMVRRLGVVFLIGGIALLFVYPVSDQIINFLWNSHIPGAETIVDRRPRVYGPLELIVTKIKVAALAGFVVGLPAFVYETYLFMRPGLYPHERRYYLAAVPTSLILALVGVAFAHFIVLPAIFAYFTSYTTGTALVAFGLKETFSLILLLMGYMALVFQIPLFIMLAIMMNLVSRRWLEEKRLLFWGAFLGLAFLVSPDPTGMAPIIVATTMIVLFEGTLTLLRWTGN